MQNEGAFLSLCNAADVASSVIVLLSICKDLESIGERRAQTQVHAHTCTILRGGPKHELQMQDESVQKKPRKRSLEGLLSESLHGLHFASCCTHLCRRGL